jgi:HEAT repeat protein
LLEILLPQLQQGSDPIREAAITALGNLGDLRAVDALLPLVNDGTPSIRERVAEALGRLGVRAAEEERLEEITPPA